MLAVIYVQEVIGSILDSEAVLSVFYGLPEFLEANAIPVADLSHYSLFIVLPCSECPLL
jgi:hypothetical protein